jgi:hypothetical protein
MARRDDVPQTVGEAVACGWEWLRVRCSFCGRSARIMFATRRRQESLASLARRAICRRCGEHTPLDCKLGMTTDCREKVIAFEGNIARKLGMG